MWYRNVVTYDSHKLIDYHQSGDPPPPPPYTFPLFSCPGTCSRDRRALQQLALNVHVKHRSDLT